MKTDMHKAADENFIQGKWKVGHPVILRRMIRLDTKKIVLVISQNYIIVLKSISMHHFSMRSKKIYQSFSIF